MDYKEVLARFRYESDDNIKSRILRSNKENYQENRDIINEIVLWKIQRSVSLTDTTLDLLNSFNNISSPLDVIYNEKVKTLIFQLLDSKGIKIAMASTILHFYYPAIFPIIDQRSYRELTSKEIPEYYSKDKNKKYTKLYLDYIKECYDYNINNCSDISFEYIDKVLYQLDLEKGNKVKY
jgi:hypothetical protein